MRIHLIIPGSNSQAILTSNVLIEEEYTSNLFSFAYSANEKFQLHLWNGLINHVNNTRNEK